MGFFLGSNGTVNALSDRFQVQPIIPVLRHDLVLVVDDFIRRLVAPLLVKLPLPHLSRSQVLLVVIHQSVVVFTALLNFVSELGMLVSDADLLLQSYLLVLELTEAVFQHESLKDETHEDCWNHTLIIHFELTYLNLLLL